MTKVNFYDKVSDELLKFAVIIAKSNGKWVFCKHRDRDTYECPGGHRDEGEDIITTAKRELFEETGAVEYYLKYICTYSVIKEYGTKESSEESFGAVFYADIKNFDELPDFEMEKIELFDQLPNKWTYPEIQPILLNKVKDMI
ncbi:NUDIX domain-containing protein [Clostridium sp. C2-6-12]|uniref:NUDIX hydrolase n=1 Tax=Clostridium sp. C2-6-12 TaxID=2698832 RepID=UPI001369754A|nr:NUDIX domain-containing protein [Clostridium sp. C2-6-12]